MAFIEALLLALTGLIILPGFSFYFDVVPKVTVLLAGTAALLIGAARSRDPGRAPRWLGGLFLAYGASLALSTALSRHPALSLYGGTWRSFGALVEAAALLFAWLVACTVAGRPDRARTVLRGIALAAIASAAYGMAQYFGWDPLIPPASYRIGEGIWTIVRPPGTLGYASYFATWLLMSGFLSLELAGMETTPGWRWMARSAAALAFAAMTLTGTRAAILGLAAGGAIALWRGGFRLSKRVSVALLVVILCGVGFYFSPPGLQLRSRSRWFQEDPWGGARLRLWRDSFSMARRRPLAGLGPETFLTEFPHYESKALAEAYPDFIHESPHNIFLDALVSQGVLGMLLLGGICILGFAAAWQRKAGWLAAALAAGLVSQQFTAFTLPTALLFFTTVALAPGDADDSRPATARERPFNLVLRSAVPFLVLALFYFALRIAMADHALAETRHHLEARDWKAASALYDRYGYWRLPGATADVWYARSWLDIARTAQDRETAQLALQNAEEAAARGTEGAEQPFAAWYTLAQIAAMREDYLGTESGLRRAIAADPNWFKPHWMLAQQLRLELRLPDARKEAALAAELDSGHHPEVKATFDELHPLQR